MANQCEPVSVCGSVFTMRVPDRAIECCGSTSDGKKPRNELTLRRQHIICRVSIMRNLSSRFATNRCERNRRIPGTIGRWSEQLMSSWISIRSLYYHYLDATWARLTRLYRVSDRRVAWNNRLRTCRALYGDPFRVVKARRFKEHPVCHDRRLFMVSVQIHASDRDLFAVTFSAK